MIKIGKDNLLFSYLCQIKEKEKKIIDIMIICNHMNKTAILTR